MKHENSRKNIKLQNFPKESIETAFENIEGLMSFNFKYLDQEQGDRFSDLTQQQLSKIMEKLKWYSNETRAHWEQEKIGQSTVLAVYNNFPLSSDFHHPKHVPVGVRWARFRMEGDQRLAGFVLNKGDVKNTELHTNVFYVVFLDNKHKFYKSDKK